MSQTTPGGMTAEKLRAFAAWIGERAGRYDAVGIALVLALETWANELEVSREEGEGWEDTEIAMREVLGADDARAALQFLQARGWRPPRLPSGRYATRDDPIATLLDALDLAGSAVTALIRDIPEPGSRDAGVDVAVVRPTRDSERLIVEFVSYESFATMLEGAAGNEIGCEVTMQHDAKGPFGGVLRIIRNDLDEPLIDITETTAPDRSVLRAFLAGVERIEVL